MIKTPQQKPDDRREHDRRQAQVSPLPFPDRRNGERRDGEDRRGEPRR